MEKITINHIPLQVKEYNGQRVVTFKNIDAVHQRPNGTARKRSNDNRKHFIESEDYFVVKQADIQKSEKRTLGFEVPNIRLTLITETGYYMLVKSFTDDLSWAVQRELTNCYFRLRDVCKQLSFDDEPEYEYFDKTYHGTPVLTIEDISHIIGVKRSIVRRHLTSKCVRNVDYCVLNGQKSIEVLAKENPNFSKKISKQLTHLSIVAKSGFIKLREAMGIKCDIPDCYRIKTTEKPSNDILDRILKDFDIKHYILTKEAGDVFLGKNTTATGNSVLLHNDNSNKIFYDNASDYYEKLSGIIQNIGFLLLGGFRESIDGKPVDRDEIRDEAKVFSATFLALKLFADYGGFDTKKK